LAGDAVLIASVSPQIPCYITGNFTGNFAILELRDPIWYQETAALQPLPEQFPNQINRENILGIRESFSGNREFQRDFVILTGLAFNTTR